MTAAQMASESARALAPGLVRFEPFTPMMSRHVD
jgi:hypothetical protein